MIRLYHSPLMRSVRIYWLLEELGIPYQLETIEFGKLQSPAYRRTHPMGKVPAIRDGDLTMFESGAILEYILERYGNGRLEAARGSADRGTFLQWIHFAEASAFPPIADVAAHSFFRPEADRIPAVVEDGKARATIILAMIEEWLANRQYLMGAEFTAADIMMGITMLGAKWYDLLTDAHPSSLAYVQRLEDRPALQKALS